MNKFEIKIYQSVSEGGTRYNEIHIYIDGKNLIHMLKSFEKTFAEREGSPNIAGAYSGLTAEFTSPGHFMGFGEKDYGEDDDKIGILDCNCGCGGCWPFAVRITVSDDSVIWSDFEQPHRTVDSVAGLWDYSDFGPFVFSIQEYQNELSKITGFAQNTEK